MVVILGYSASCLPTVKLDVNAMNPLYEFGRAPEFVAQLPSDYRPLSWVPNRLTDASAHDGPDSSMPAVKSSDKPDPAYRLNVGICLVKGHQVFLAKRRKQPQYGWQMPQGGVEEGEDVEAAAFRELFEETGIPQNRVEILAELPEWLSYDFPPEVRARLTGHWRDYKGQTQRWYLMRFIGQDSEIDIHSHDAEFSEWRWGSLQAAVDEVVPFKRGVYQKMAAAFAPLINSSAH
eukprot:jgi/Mesvir1/22887/Mv19410-RA.1